jgi:hypothetical protein
MWPAQGLTAGQMLAIDAYWRERDITLTQFEKAKSGLPWDLILKDNGWCWFFGAGAILWLADRAGLEVVDAAIEWGGQARIYMARRKRK